MWLTALHANEVQCCSEITKRSTGYTDQDACGLVSDESVRQVFLDLFTFLLTFLFFRGNITIMKKERGQYINIKVWFDTRRKLRQIAALSDKNMVEVIDLLATRELEKIQQKKDGS